MLWLAVVRDRSCKKQSTAQLGTTNPVGLCRQMSTESVWGVVFRGCFLVGVVSKKMA
ncbi:hypothetical protein HanXRQr2_Chr15g0711011 [Helianthus annuus]|uniref:Uncharacterized protein n=1 Tax=Helianthus annuus TaxID=4232 RepID=A0A9K3E484_HELAN|nr:hypothetical protein HanXRQr2_Chr15g0711011 [Helianthus annuus]KAJ0923993.1 hypothetical protein HanPSC8_Chr05g0223111 [Helianthus annuus]